MPALTPRSAPKWITDPAISVLTRLGVTPNMLTLFGFAGNVGAAVLAANGRFLEAGIVMLAFSALDFLDGSLARATGRATPFGSVLDSTMDRLSEAVVLFGLLWYFSDLNAREEVLLIFAAVVASFLVSYTRARAEIVGVPMREGLFGRAERVLLLGVGLMIGEVTETAVTVALWILAVAAGATFIQRLALVWLRAGRSGDERP